MVVDGSDNSFFVNDNFAVTKVTKSNRIAEPVGQQDAWPVFSAIFVKELFCARIVKRFRSVGAQQNNIQFFGRVLFL